MLLWSPTLPACERAWLTSDKNYSPLWLNVRHCLAVLYLFAYTVCESASPVSSPKLHLTEDAAHAGSQVGGACWSVWRQVEGTQLWGGRRRLTDLPWAVACTSGKDLPSNHLQERGCGRIITTIPVRGVTFPLMHWSETSSDVRRRVGEIERQERHEKLDCREQLIKSLFLSFYVLTLFA